MPRAFAELAKRTEEIEPFLAVEVFSKAYAMTGWRLGYPLAPKAHVRTLQTLYQNTSGRPSRLGVGAGGE